MAPVRWWSPMSHWWSQPCDALERATVGIPKLLNERLDDLGIDYVNIRNDLVDAVTLEDAQRVARALFRPEDLTVVIVGRPDGVVPEGSEADEKS